MVAAAEMAGEEGDVSQRPSFRHVYRLHFYCCWRARLPSGVAPRVDVSSVVGVTGTHVELAVAGKTWSFVGAGPTVGVCGVL